MRHDIIWLLSLRVTSTKKAIKLLDRFRTAMNMETVVVSCERDTTDPRLFQAQITSPLAIHTIQAAIVEVLCASSRVTGRWMVGAPQQVATGAWEFAAHASEGAIGIAGIVSIVCQVHVEPHDTRLDQPPIYSG
jgi:hypothetical protein